MRLALLPGLLGLLALSAWPAAAAAQTLVPEITYFRIGTGPSSGTYFPVGGLIATGISRPPGTPSCAAGGSCGVDGLVAVAQATEGSVDNLARLRSGDLESALVQADLAHAAYHGAAPFDVPGRDQKLRSIASLFPEAMHLVVRQDSAITSIRGLGFKPLSLGGESSGTMVIARRVLAAYGLAEADFETAYVTPLYLRPDAAGAALMEKKITAFFVLAGAPIKSVAALTGRLDLRFLPLFGAPVDQIIRTSRFVQPATIPAGTYRGQTRDVPTLGVDAQWIISADQPEELVYEITRALWHDRTLPILRAGHPLGQNIRLTSALRGLGAPLHPGAARFYRERGLLPSENGGDR
ncbi:MAG: TAXI family TRAP transporter solute-binding subunit [Alphaproteobacteria bacterium]